jgi:hypothetical protein
VGPVLGGASNPSIRRNTIGQDRHQDTTGNGGDGRRRMVVTVAPITHRHPDDPATAIELSAATRRRLGLGKQDDWIMATEVNSFYWPPPDLRPTAKGHCVRRIARGRIRGAVRRRFLRPDRRLAGFRPGKRSRREGCGKFTRP